MDRRPNESEYAEYFGRYISLVPENDALPILRDQIGILGEIASRIPVDREHYRYAEGKWSLREVLGHLIDAERVFGYRAFCISRGERAPLPAFDENSYVERSGYDGRSISELLEEFVLVRRCNISFLIVLTDEQWTQIGTASGKPISVRALPFVMAGHVRHHLKILNDRYGVVAR